MKSKGLKLLKKYGFKIVGEWEKSERNNKSGITFNIDQKWKRKRVIYAFVINGEIKYIGICQSYNTTLEKRMERYRSKQGGGTNSYIANKIKCSLDNKKKVEIHAVDPASKKVKYYGLEVDLVKGLENPLIAKLKPKWNKQK